MKQDIENFKILKTYLSHDHRSSLAKGLTLIEMLKESDDQDFQQMLSHLQKSIKDAIEKVDSMLIKFPLSTKVLWVSPRILHLIPESFIDDGTVSPVILENFQQLCKKLEIYGPDYLILEEEFFIEAHPLFAQKVGLFPISILGNQKKSNSEIREYADLGLLQILDEDQLRQDLKSMSFFS